MPTFEKEVFICLDCETTGLDVNLDRIIEVAIIKFDFEMHGSSFESLFDPEMTIPEASIAIHHITQDMVTGQPLIASALPEMLALIGKHTIIGHGIEFDVALIANAADRAGIPHTLRNNRTYDTLRMARLYGESPTNSLEQLRQHFNIPHEGAHRAMSDVIVNIAVFKYLARRYKTTELLSDALSRPILLKNMPLGPHKGRSMKEVPIEYLRWAVTKNFDQDLIHSLRTELKRRKGGNLFSQATNPFSGL
jgi:DNA polymerase-3 subunit epsilon